QSSQRLPSFGRSWYPTCACASCCAEAVAGSDAKTADIETKAVCLKKLRRESMSDLRPSSVNPAIASVALQKASHRKSLSVLLSDALVPAPSKLLGAPSNLVNAVY